MLEKWRDFVNSDEELPAELRNWLSIPADFKTSSEGENFADGQLRGLGYQLIKELEPKLNQEYERYTISELENFLMKKNNLFTKAVVSRMIKNVVGYMADAGWLTDGKYDQLKGGVKLLKADELSQSCFRLVLTPNVKADFYDYLADWAQLSCQPASTVYSYRLEAKRLRMKFKNIDYSQS